MRSASRLAEDIVTIRQSESLPRKCLGHASNSSTQRATAVRATSFPNSRLVADINAPHSISASRMSLAQGPLDVARFVAIGTSLTHPLIPPLFARSSSVRDANKPSTFTNCRRHRIGDLANSNCQITFHQQKPRRTAVLITAAGKWGSRFSRRQEIREVKSGHANSVVSHSVIDIEAIR